MSEPVRVAFVIPRLACGGVETFLLRLCPRLRERGYDVEVVTTEERGQWFDRFTAALPTVHLEGADRFPRCGHPFRVGRELGRRGYDVLFVNSDPLTQQSLAMLPDRVVAIPIVHSDLDRAYRIAATNREAWNVLVAVGPRIAAMARERAPQRPVVEIRMGVELPSEADRQRRRAMTGEELRVIFLGRIAEAVKNVMILPEVLRRCRDRGMNARLTIAGDGPDLGRLRARVEELSLTPHVRFAGEVPLEAVYELLLDHHALVLPSFFEGLPLALLEAQACGCVPVASLLPGVTTAAVEDGRTGRLVSPGDTEGFATALEGLQRDPATWGAMSAAGHALVAERFSPDRMTRDYANLIEDAVAGRYRLSRSRRGRLPVAPELYWRLLVPAWMRGAARRMLGRSTATAR